MQNILKTERLILRRPVLSDAERMATLLSDPEIVRMTISLPYPYFPISAEFWIMQQTANWRRGISYAYAITGDDDHIMGIMDLFTNGDGDREIGYWLGKPYWGKGYITEAAQAVLDEGFTSFDIPYIDAGYFYDNPGSGRVLEKLGFVRKEHGSNFFSVSRGECAAGIELRLPRPETIKPGMNAMHQSMQKAAQ